MHLVSLTIEQLRLFDRVVLDPGTGINMLSGANGAGKTSVLEAIHVLASGRSFRGAVRDALIRQGDNSLRVFANVFHEREARPYRLGLERSSREWSARLDGMPVARLSALFHTLAVVCFDPGSHALISGGAESRRRFVDWGLFHVEHSFINSWRRYQRALRQRNALLKQRRQDDESLSPWEDELSVHGARLHVLRAAWLSRVQIHLASVASDFLPELGLPRLRYHAGWSDALDAEGLRAALASSRARDLVLGHTTQGPHRADWSISFEHAPLREMFSRGQEKLVVLCCLLAQACDFYETRGEWPLLLLDDLPSELDAEHLSRAVAWIADRPVQAFVTGVAPMQLPGNACRETRMFHVEHGRLSRLL